ncbi:type II toxin-antitoxin system PemK/MazF family toxin [Mycobacterium sp. 050128]|uniref:type II toxin-antitoxin system PemK/MazF family toxin n=1 Tax=Mycobacterium sp. 050128 TaxID=3096112 RepID=UPI002ED7F730
MIPRRGEVWRLDDGRSVLVLSSTFYNEISSEPTIIVVPVFTGEPAAGFGVPIGNDTWAAPGFITSLRKTRLAAFHERADVQCLTDVNNMLFKILATPDR